MQIVIPMSGFGERFKRAGYTVPKPLIPVDGKPIISHVVDLYPGAEDFIFICNKEHLNNPDFEMEAILNEIAPNGKIIAIDPHKLGPVHAVLQAADAIDKSKPVIVNYCDFTCYWDFSDFKKFVIETDCDGAVPAYKGFHPHSLGSTFYAYIEQTDLWMSAIKEKEPFTSNPQDEFASTGAYYFRNGALCIDAFRKQVKRPDLQINGEFYASLAYRVLLENSLNVAVYPIEHFMQWGTPQDLELYSNWSNAFRRLSSNYHQRARQSGSILIPMAGLGSRFTKEGYERPKALIEVSGRPMVIQATRDLPDAPIHHFVLRQDMPHLDEILTKLKTSFTGAEYTILDKVTEGQALTCLVGVEKLPLDQPVTISACDNGVIYNEELFQDLLQDDAVDVIVWVASGHAAAKYHPEMFGWVEVEEDGVATGVSVKKTLNDPRTDPMIVGTFTFKKASDYLEAARRLVARNERVNGEYYVDSLIYDAIKLGLNVKVFEIDAYIGWGTPDDLKTYNYWQSCFHKWNSHPYRLERDHRIPGTQLARLSTEYASFKPMRPGAKNI